MRIVVTVLAVAIGSAHYAPREKAGMVAAEIVGDSLCTAQEQLAFGFDVPSRHATVAVCTLESPDTTYVVYRFGTKDSVQLRYPAAGSPWRYKFMHNSYHRPGGAANDGLDLEYLDFSNKGVCYRVFQEWSAESQQTSVGIRIWVPGRRTPVEIKGTNPRGSLSGLFQREGFAHDKSCAPE